MTNEAGLEHQPIKVTGTLEQWYFEENPPHGFCIWGYIQNDSKGRFHNDTRIHTSQIEKLVLPVNNPDAWYAYTMNSVYKLGTQYKRPSRTPLSTPDYNTLNNF